MLNYRNYVSRMCFFLIGLKTASFLALHCTVSLQKFATPGRKGEVYPTKVSITANSM